MTSVSIVMTAYQRAQLLERTLHSIVAQKLQPHEVVVVEDGDDGGATRVLCGSYPSVRYFQRKRRPNIAYSNPAVPNNIGIRQAVGDIIILQNAECVHITPNLVESFMDRIEKAPSTAILASVLALDAAGNPYRWYTHGRYNRRPYFFCGAIRREHLLHIRGFDEDYLEYGFDDNDLADRLCMTGIQFDYADELLAHHLWHGPDIYPSPHSILLYERKKTQGPVRNLNREWGQVE